jgi:DNA-binding CsgD family transcriptional regulator
MELAAGVLDDELPGDGGLLLVARLLPDRDLGGEGGLPVFGETARRPSRPLKPGCDAAIMNGRSSMDLRMRGDGHDAVRPALELQERRVLELVAEGLSNREIAAQLGVPVEAVRDFLGAIFAKLGVGSKTEALIVAFRRGLIGPPVR